MSSEALDIKRVANGAYARYGLIACKIQGTAICHIKGMCSVCPIALARLNPDKPLSFFIKNKEEV